MRKRDPPKRREDGERACIRWKVCGVWEEDGREVWEINNRRKVQKDKGSVYYIEHIPSVVCMLFVCINILVRLLTVSVSI